MYVILSEAKDLQFRKHEILRSEATKNDMPSVQDDITTIGSGSNLAVKCRSNSGAYVNRYPCTDDARSLIFASVSAT